MLNFKPIVYYHMFAVGLVLLGRRRDTDDRFFSVSLVWSILCLLRLDIEFVVQIYTLNLKIHLI